MRNGKPIAIFGEHEPKTLAQLEDVASRAERAALMADGHLGYVMPIGGVAAYRRPGVGRRRRLRHRLRQRRDPHRPHARSGDTPGLVERLPRSPTRSRTSCQLRHRPEEPRRRRAGRSSAVRRARRGTRVPPKRARRRCGARRARSSARSAAATTTWTSSPTRRARSGSACTSAAAASATRSRPASSRSSQGEQWGERVPEREVLLPLDEPMGHDYWALMKLAGRVRLRRPRVGGAQGRVDPRRPRARAGAQPSQLRLARRARRRGADRRAQGRDAGVSGSEGLHRRLDGRRRGDRAGRDARRIAGEAAAARPRCSRPCTAPAASCRAPQAAGKRNWRTGKVLAARARCRRR